MNTNFLFDVVLALSALLASGRIVYLRLNHDAYFRKHKAGTIEYTRAKQLTSVKACIIATVVTPLFILKTILDGYSLIHAEGRMGVVDVELIVGFVCLGVVITFLVIYNISQGMK
jgi:hypothetical protein